MGVKYALNTASASPVLVVPFPFEIFVGPSSVFTIAVEVGCVIAGWDISNG